MLERMDELLRQLSERISDIVRGKELAGKSSADEMVDTLRRLNDQ